MDDFWRSFLGDVNLWSVLTILADVAIVFFLLYRGLLLIRGTRAVQMLVGLTLVILLFFASKSEYLDLPTLNWLLDKVIASSLFIVVVLFQKEIRRALVEVGKNPLLSAGRNPEAVQFYEEVVRAVVALAQKSLGGLVVIERETDLSEYALQAIQLDAVVTRELLFSLFIPQYQNPTHDGAVLIQKGRITAAGCYLPLIDNPDLDKALGTRHRAALGLSDETDAVVIVVSEETGIVSIARDGVLMRGLDTNTLRAELQRSFGERRRASVLVRLGGRFGVGWGRLFRRKPTVPAPPRDEEPAA